MSILYREKERHCEGNDEIKTVITKPERAEVIYKKIASGINTLAMTK